MSLDVITTEGRMVAFLSANVGLPFCLSCIAAELRASAPEVVAAAAALVGGERFKLTNRCCARCLSEQAVMYQGLK